LQNPSDNRPQVWPVIHLRSLDLGIENAQITADSGCPGVFLISMDGNDESIDPIADSIKTRLPNLLVGVNYLTKTAEAAIARSLKAGHHATWADGAGIRSDEDSALPARCAALLAGRKDHQFFASFDFKYQRKDPNPPRAARMALDLGFVPTTSGMKTGSAPVPAKLAAIRDEIGIEAPLAVASGITPDNVASLGPYLSHILVATGISRSFYEFDADLLGTLMRNRPLRMSSNDTSSSSPAQGE
jgi:hypothetical protein